MVECQLPKLKVAGSIPVARSSELRATVRCDPTSHSDTHLMRAFLKGKLVPPGISLKGPYSAAKV